MMPLIPVMQPTDARQGYDTSVRRRALCYRPRVRRILVEREMTSIPMIIGKIGLDKPVKMVFTENNDVIEELPAYCSHKSLRDWILPRRPVGRPNDLHAHGFQSSRHDLAVFPVPVEYKVTWRVVFREGFSELLHNPQGVRLDCNSEVKDFAAGMVNDEKDIQKLKRCRRDREEVHARQTVAVVSKESDPPLQ